jgi:Zn-dependent M28 family amino/carboxypeptidase
MNKYAGSLFLAVLVGCLVKGFAQPGLERIHAETLKQMVMQFSHDSMQGRLTGTAGAEKATAWLERKFGEIGLQTISGNDGYLQLFEIATDFGSVYSANVMGLLPAEKRTDTLFILSAHYDHIGTGEQYKQSFPEYNTDWLGTPTAKDTIFNGANDNASGISALLALASFFKSMPASKYNLLFVAFGAEEFGTKGSHYMVQLMETSFIKRMVNLEMLGRPNKLHKFRPLITESHDNSLRKMLNNEYKRLYPDDALPYFQADALPFSNLFIRSDNIHFAQAGVPANTVMATYDKDAFYHRPGDEWDTFDYAFIEKTVRILAMCLWPMISSEPVEWQIPLPE